MEDYVRKHRHRGTIDGTCYLHVARQTANSTPNQRYNVSVSATSLPQVSLESFTWGREAQKNTNKDMRKKTTLVFFEKSNTDRGPYPAEEKAKKGEERTV